LAINAGKCYMKHTVLSKLKEEKNLSVYVFVLSHVLLVLIVENAFTNVGSRQCTVYYGRIYKNTQSKQPVVS